MSAAKKGNLSKAFLEKEYLKNKKSAAQIGKELGRSKPNILNWLKKYNIPRRKTREPLDITNQKFGHLTALKCLGPNLNSRTSYRWECICDCGRIKIIEVGRLKYNKGGNISCGRCKFYNEIPNSAWAKPKRNARHEWKLTDEYLWNLYLSQNKKCALTGIDIYFPKSYKEIREGKQTASLDRIDSNKPYIEGNVQWVYKPINFMKQKYSQKEFINLCKAVYLWNKNKKF